MRIQGLLGVAFAALALTACSTNPSTIGTLAPTAIGPTSLPASTIPWDDPSLRAAIEFCPQVDPILARNFFLPGSGLQANKQYVPSTFEPQCYGEWQQQGSSTPTGIFGGSTFSVDRDAMGDRWTIACRRPDLVQAPAVLQPLTGIGRGACINGADGMYHVTVLLSHNRLLVTFVQVLNNGVPDSTARSDVIAMATDLIRTFHPN